MLHQTSVREYTFVQNIVITKYIVQWPVFDIMQRQNYDWSGNNIVLQSNTNPLVHLRCLSNLTKTNLLDKSGHINLIKSL